MDSNTSSKLGDITVRLYWAKQQAAEVNRTDLRDRLQFVEKEIITIFSMIYDMGNE